MDKKILTFEDILKLRPTGKLIIGEVRDEHYELRDERPHIKDYDIDKRKNEFISMINHTPEHSEEIKPE